MEWQIIVALVIAIPIILFPVAFVWYLNIGGIYALIKKTREERVAYRKDTKLNEAITQEHEYENALIDTLEQYPWYK